jgi:hypothetical protein
MARAFIGNVPCQVLVDRDLGDSWAVTVLPPPGARVGDRELAPQVVKLQGEGRPQVAKGALEILQKAGQIDRFELDLPPAPAPAEGAPAAEAKPPAPQG